MKVLGIIGAMEEEVTMLKEKIELKNVESVAGMEFLTGNLYNHNVIIVRCGIGKVNAAICTQLLIDQFKVQAVINTGVAGALHPELNIGDIVISKDTLQHDFDVTGFGHPIGEIPRMETSIFKADQTLIQLTKNATKKIKNVQNVYIERIVSGDQFISDHDKKTYIFKTFNGYCTEMEGAAIAQTCYLNTIPFVIIRAISDKADKTAEINFSEFVQETARRSSEIISLMLKSL